MKMASSALALALAASSVANAATLRPLAYAQPAEHTTVGPVKQLPGAAVLPSGRLLNPAGLHPAIDGDVVAAATDPSGRRLVLVSRRTDGARVSVLDARTLHELAHADLAGAVPGGGLAILRDPKVPKRSVVALSMGLGAAVDFLDLQSDGQLAPDAVPTVQWPSDGQPHFIGEIAGAPRTALLFAVDELSGTVTSIDIRTRKRIAKADAGLAPHGLSVAGSLVVATNEGIVEPSPLSSDEPQYGGPVLDLDRASSLSIIHYGGDPQAPGKLGSVKPVPMDRAPKGAEVGGAHPAAVAGAGRYLYVALAGVDRIAVLDTASGKIISGTELRFFDKGPYGMEPVSLALDTRRKRLYVALQGADAVAVLDVTNPKAPHRLGLIPAGNAPTRIVFDPVTTALYIVSGRGYGQRRASIVQRVDVAQPDWASMTRTTLKNLRRIVTAENPRPAARVVQIRMPAATFDEVFGTQAGFGYAVMPNLHKLAHDNALAANIYSEANGPLSAAQFALAGEATPYTLRTEAIGGARRWEGTPEALGPDDAPRFGYIFDALSRAKIPYRNYGALPAMSRYAKHSDAVYAAVLAAGRAQACAAEFVRDHAANSDARFIEIALPDAGDDPREAQKSADTALGSIMAALQKDVLWSQTVVIISPWWTHNGADHVDPRRTYAVVVSPSGRKALLSGHRTITGLLKTEEQLLGLEPSMLGDLISTPIQFEQAGESRPNG